MPLTVRETKRGTWNLSPAGKELSFLFLYAVFELHIETKMGPKKAKKTFQASEDKSAKSKLFRLVHLAVSCR